MKTLFKLFAPWLGIGCAVALTGTTGISAPLPQSEYHLRSGTEPEWQEFTGKTPHGRRLDLTFTAQRNSAEATLVLRQRDVKYDWVVELNGRKLGTLFLKEEPLVYALPIPVGSLRDGENQLAIFPRYKENDDIVVSGLQLLPKPMEESLSEAGLDLQVTDADTQRPIPCRITIADSAGALVAIYAPSNQPIAVRPGVIYARDGQAKVGLLAGDYTVYASRGFDYGLAKQQISVKPGERRPVRLQIRRELPNLGLVSCDHHMHTLTYGKHGDAKIEECMLTLAGEGIQMPISTEHNLLADFSAPAEQTGVNSYFMPVLGCEVTTRAGHFNAFPIQSGSRVPDFKITDWPRLMESIRATPGVRVVVLNHPCDDHNNFVPFARTNLNPVTGENLHGFEFTFDAVELVNSGALRTDYMEPYRSWFALLNYGYRFTGVAGSDSHDVSRFIIGQARTYIPAEVSGSGEGRPFQINQGQAMENLLRGRACVSMGLLTLLKVNDQFGPGDLISKPAGELKVNIQVLGPSWSSADRVELFANGSKIRAQAIPLTTKVEKATITWNIPRPAQDVYLVAIASGPGIQSPHWATPRPYQPSSPVWEPRVLGSTNPVWVDGDGDGKFTSARTYAKELIQRVGTDWGRLLPELAKYDEAVAAQAAGLCYTKTPSGRETSELLKKAAPQVQRAFAAYAQSLKP